jgi:hypothetical protein
MVRFLIFTSSPILHCIAFYCVVVHVHVRVRGGVFPGGCDALWCGAVRCGACPCSLEDRDVQAYAAAHAYHVIPSSKSNYSQVSR